jgi:hypothetical protein
MRWSLVKAQQELKHEPKVQTNSEKGGYKKDPRRVYGPDYEPKMPKAVAVECVKSPHNGDFTHSHRTAATDNKTQRILTFLSGAIETFLSGTNTVKSRSIQ